MCGCGESKDSKGRTLIFSVFRLRMEPASERRSVDESCSPIGTPVFKQLSTGDATGTGLQLGTRNFVK